MIVADCWLRACGGVISHRSVIVQIESRIHVSVNLTRGLPLCCAQVVNETKDGKNKADKKRIKRDSKKPMKIR